MAWFNFFKTKSKKRKATPEKIRTVQATRIAPDGPQTGFGSVHIPIEAFVDLLPQHLVSSTGVDRSRKVQVNLEDAVIDAEHDKLEVPLSILSLSCPDLFTRPVDSNEEIVIAIPRKLLHPADHQEPEITMPPGGSPVTDRPFKPGVTERLTAVVHEISTAYQGIEQ
jgi:hypothetical protein